MDNNASTIGSENSGECAQLVEKPEKTKYVYKPKEKLWSPDVDYAKKLAEIQAQRTPAELYRHKLDTIGRHARDMQRLEWRWSRDLDLWVSPNMRPLGLVYDYMTFVVCNQEKCASRVKAGWRGMKGRIYFTTVRSTLVIQREQREARISATDQYNAGKLFEATDTISAVKYLTPDLQLMKCKFLYQLQRYSDCIAACKTAIGELVVCYKRVCRLFS